VIPQNTSRLVIFIKGSFEGLSVDITVTDENCQNKSVPITPEKSQRTIA